MVMKEPWIEAPHIWPTKAAFFSSLRGMLRRAVWEKWPLKIEFKNEVCDKPPEDYTGRAKTGAYCALTGEWVGKSAAEIDHIEGHISLCDWEDVLPFIQHLCASKDNMQYVSKEAHKVKSYAERMGISFEEALLLKRVIQMEKDKTLKKFLDDHGVTCKATQRREKALEILRKEEE